MTAKPKPCPATLPGERFPEGGRDEYPCQSKHGHEGKHAHKLSGAGILRWEDDDA